MAVPRQNTVRHISRLQSIKETAKKSKIKTKLPDFGLFVLLMSDSAFRFLPNGYAAIILSYAA